MSIKRGFPRHAKSIKSKKFEHYVWHPTFGPPTLKKFPHALWRHLYILIGESRAKLCSMARCRCKLAAGRKKVRQLVIMATSRRSLRSTVKGHVGTAIQHSYLARNQAASWPQRCAPRSGFARSAGPHPHAGLLTVLHFYFGSVPFSVKRKFAVSVRRKFR